MRALFIALALAAGAMACTPIHSVTAPATAEARAQSAIDEANVLIAAAANVIAQNVKDGVMSRDEAQAALDRVRGFAGQLDEAQGLIREGQHVLAQNRAQLAHRLLLALHREVAAKARQQ